MLYLVYPFDVRFQYIMLFVRVAFRGEKADYGAVIHRTLPISVIAPVPFAQETI